MPLCWPALGMHTSSHNISLYQDDGASQGRRCGRLDRSGIGFEIFIWIPCWL